MKSKHEIKKFLIFQLKKLKYIDTAHDYGNSEKVIGKYSKINLKLISKINAPKIFQKKKSKVLLKKK